MLDHNDVAMFVRIVRAGSFTNASTRWGIPANTLSRRIRNLEHRLGVQLLNRSTRRLALTTAGEQYFSACTQAVEQIELAGEMAKSTAQAPSGVIRVAAPTELFNWFPIEWILTFLSEHPLVELDFVLSDSLANLSEEGIDVALRGAPLTDMRYVAKKLADHQNVLVASPAYIERCGEIRSPSSLAAHSCIASYSQRQRILWRLTGEHEETEIRVSGRFSANTIRAQLKAALAGLGVALLPTTLVNDEIAKGKLQRVLPEYHRDGGGIYLIHAASPLRPAAVSAFLEYLTRKLDGLDGIL